MTEKKKQRKTERTITAKTIGNKFISTILISCSKNKKHGNHKGLC